MFVAEFEGEMYTSGIMHKDKFVVKGLDGSRSLKGRISVSGAKNAALQAFAFSLLFRDTLRIENVPDIEDTKLIIALLQSLKVRIDRIADHTFDVTPPNKLGSEMSHELSRRMRASVVLTGPILARTGRVIFPHPGGCVIGNRPIDVFLNAYKKMGANCKESAENYNIKAYNSKLSGTDIFLRVPSVTGTQTIMMAAILAKGKTVIKNAALEPETEHFANFLNDCGAKISGAGTSGITIIGDGLLIADGKSYVVPPDRVEAGSFLILAALAGKDVLIENCDPSHIEALTESLKDSGVNMEIKQGSIRIKSTDKIYKAVEIKTHEYPGFPTDLQAPMVVFLTQAVGESLVFETIFEGRLNYTEQLTRMGADIKMWDTHRVTTKGPTKLHGKELESPDIRAGLAFLLAGIIAKGESVIHNAYYIDRGYENIEKRLLALGVQIQRITE
ncbi:MAG: UDP-N-acetylglucosamine 1-carboxyvinyltransferase [Candidatus Vogelbacteria bacterium]|nr:UDP-N-acetylglucosamine 1-carboxyvinyltransferase [Candidatus Vogelbacteria bacterium]